MKIGEVWRKIHSPELIKIISIKNTSGNNIISMIDLSDKSNRPMLIFIKEKEFLNRFILNKETEENNERE